MSQNKIIITNYQTRQLMSVFQDDVLTDLYFDEENSAVGNIYVGKVKNIVKNINAAFVEIGENVLTYFSIKEETPIFLNRKNNDNLVPGDEILVQIVKDGIKTKAPQVSSKLTLPGKYLVLNLDGKKVGVSNKSKDVKKRKEIKAFVASKLPQDFGAIIRTNAQYADMVSLEAELMMLSEQLRQIMDTAPYRKAGQCLFHVPNGFLRQVNSLCNDRLKEIITDIPEVYKQLLDYFELYDEVSKQKLRLYQDDTISLSSAYNITRSVENAQNKRVWLKSGAYLVIEQTEAMVVIDVNTGKAIGKQNMEEHFYKINVEAAKECAYQIRLRNLSGMILIDFINMQSREHNEGLIQLLKKEIAQDIVKTNYIDTTGLGLVELTRKKVRKSLNEQII